LVIPHATVDDLKALRFIESQGPLVVRSDLQKHVSGSAVISLRQQSTQ
jgi:hypothetical protein